MVSPPIVGRPRSNERGPPYARRWSTIFGSGFSLDIWRCPVLLRPGLKTRRSFSWVLRYAAAKPGARGDERNNARSADRVRMMVADIILASVLRRRRMRTAFP